MSKNKNVFAVDFETYYDNDCSITTLGTLGYFSHPDFDAYMVSIVGDEGTYWVGHPKAFNWENLNGQIILSHNASFDETLYLFGVNQGWWPEFKPYAWHCTADLAAYCGLPRSLKGASSSVFNLDVSKDTRDNMKNKRWESMTAEFQKEVSDYALKDSELCLELWFKLKNKWPIVERNISAVNRKITQRGIPIDEDLLKEQKEKVELHLFEAKNSIPWIEDYTPLSRKAFNEECRKNHLEPPATLALSSDVANKWIDKYGVKFPWINAVRDFRRINSLQRKLKSFDVATMPDGRFYGGIMYFGAHTGRFSGSGGNLNLQNLPRGEMFGSNLRHLIHPKKGKKLIVADLSQIEVRTLCYLAEDEKALEEIKASEDIYEAFAIRFKKWDKSQGCLKDEDPALRHTVKAMVLGCGYGVSAYRFGQIANMDYQDAQNAVSLYRDSMKSVVAYWRHLQSKMIVQYDDEKPFELELPSERVLNYGLITSNNQKGKQIYIGELTKGSKKVPVKLWGGLLAENMSQALARDIFSDMLVRISNEGINIIFHVHDEVVIEVDESDAEKTLETVIEIMSTPPKWIDLPLAAEGKILERYEK
jgi:DNA polymerase